MIATKKFIQKIKLKYHLEIPKELEDYILAEFEEEPFPYEYEPKELEAEIRTMAKQYKNGELDITIEEPIKRLEKRYRFLQMEYIELVAHSEILMDALEEAGITIPEDDDEDEFIDDDDLPFN